MEAETSLIVYLSNPLREGSGKYGYFQERDYLFGRWPMFLKEKGDQREVSLMDYSFQEGEAFTEMLKFHRNK